MRNPALLAALLASLALPAFAETKSTLPPIAARPADALKSLRAAHDPASGITWYAHPSVDPHAVASAVYVYFGRTGAGQTLPLRLRVRYGSEQPLFIKRARAQIDGAQVSFPQQSQAYGWARDPRGAEWSDATLQSAADTAAVLRLAAGRSVMLRFEGRSYYDERTVPAEQLKALRETIDAYLAVGGQLP